MAKLCRRRGDFVSMPWSVGERSKLAMMVSARVAIYSCAVPRTGRPTGPVGLKSAGGQARDRPVSYLDQE
jgi:hypothetical protein